MMGVSDIVSLLMTSTNKTIVPGTVNPLRKEIVLRMIK